MSIIYKMGECCMNCKYRIYRIDTNITCSRFERKSDDNEAWMPERGWCSCYERTINKHILRAEKALIERMKNYIEGDGE